MKNILWVVVLAAFISTPSYAAEWDRTDSGLGTNLATLISEDGEAMFFIICSQQEQDCSFNIMSNLKNEPGNYYGVTMTSEGHPKRKYTATGQGYHPSWKGFQLRFSYTDAVELMDLLNTGDVAFNFKVKSGVFKSGQYDFVSTKFKENVHGIAAW